MTKRKFRELVITRAKEGNKIIVTIPKSMDNSVALSFARSILPLIRINIQKQKYPMVGQHAKLSGIIFFAESQKLLEDKKYLSDFIEKSWKQCKTSEIITF